MVNLKELCLISGKASWMAYLDIYCLDADGALFDTTLFSAVAAFSHLHIPTISVNDDGRVFLTMGEQLEGNLIKEPINTEKRRLTLRSIPFSLTCILQKKYILADPTTKEDSVMETLITVVLYLSGRLVSFFNPGGSFLASTSAIQDFIAIAKQGEKEMETILHEAITDMDND